VLSGSDRAAVRLLERAEAACVKAVSPNCENCGLLGYYAASCGNCLLVYLYLIYLASSLYFPPLLLLCSVLFSSCLSCLHSRYPQQLYVVCIHPSLTLVLPYWLSSHLRIATPPYFPESTL
jgi:hypothetical protein